MLLLATVARADAMGVEGGLPLEGLATVEPSGKGMGCVALRLI